MSKRSHILFARVPGCGCLYLESDSDAAGTAMIDDPDLAEWVEDEQAEEMVELDPGFYVWEGYFLDESEGYHVDTKLVRPATTTDFFMLGFPIPQTSGGAA